MTEQLCPPALKSLPLTTAQASAADQQTCPTTERAEVVARKGVLSALRPDPHTTTAPTADRRTAA